MPLSITALYAGILALILIALAINVTVHRVKLRVPLGDGGNAEMRRMIRLARVSPGSRSRRWR